MKYLKDNDLLPDLQSAYRAMHSTETAVLKVLADILLALDSGDLAMLTLLDLSAAFDSVDHDTLLNHHHHIRFWYLWCCGCPGLRGRQHLATPHTRSPRIPV